MRKLTHLACNRPWRVLVIAGVTFVVAAVLGAPIINQLQASLSDFEDPGTQTASVARSLSRAVRAQDQLGLVALMNTGFDLHASKATRRQQLSAAAAKQERVAALISHQRGVRNVYDYPQTGDSELLSRDGSEAIVMATFATRELAYHAAQRLRTQLRSEHVSVGGLDPIFEEITHRSRSDLARAELYAFPLLLLLTLWVFRGLVAAVLPLVVGAFAILGTFLGLRIVEQFLGISVFALNLSSALGLGLAIDYSLFVLSRYREERAAGDGAVGRTLQTAGRTVLYSSLTVTAAMASLCVFPLPFLYSMGIAGALTALIAGAVSLVVLPAILVVLGARIDALAPSWMRRSPAPPGASAEGGFWSRLARAVMRRPGPIALATGALLLAMGAPVSQLGLTPASDSLLPTSSEARQVQQRLNHNFVTNPALPIAAIAHAPRSELHAVIDYAGDIERASGEPEHVRVLYLGNSTWVIAVAPRGDPFSSANEQLLRRLRAVTAPFPVAVGGITAWYKDQLSSIATHLPIALAIIVLTMFATIFAMTGSAVLPLKTFIMNLLTLSATTGLLVLAFQDEGLNGILDFRGNGGLEPSNLVLLLVAAFALASDYGVFLLGRIKEAHDAGLENRDAVAVGMERTGRLITAAALLFCVAVGALVSSSILSIKELGLGAALAVAIDASIVRALLVPSLMALLGDWNWWAPSWMRRLHARVGVREHGGGGPATPGTPVGSPSSPGS
jgi:RND superfamily putative drug exporter